MQRSCNEVFLIISYLFLSNFLFISILARSSFIDGFRFRIGGGVVSFFYHFLALFSSFLRIPPAAFYRRVLVSSIFLFFQSSQFLYLQSSNLASISYLLSSMYSLLRSFLFHVVVGNASHGCGRGPCRKPSVHDAFCSAGLCESSQEIRADKLPGRERTGKQAYNPGWCCMDHGFGVFC